MATPQCAVEAVLVPSNEMPADAVTVAGPQVQGGSLEDVVAALKTTGYQATNVGFAVEECEAMLRWRLSEDQVALNTARQHATITDEEAAGIRSKVFLGATSVLFLAGSREAINFLCRHRMVDVIVTPGGGIDFDILRSIRPDLVTVAEYNSTTTPKGCSRHGNILVREAEARAAVIAFVTRVLEEHASQRSGETRESIEPEQGLPLTCTPSELVALLGKALAPHDSSCLRWCAEHGIPVYSPSLVDGWVGHALFAFNKSRKAAGLEALKVDLVKDVKLMNTEATSAKHTGMLILGGGVVKHHICNANLMRNGADHSVLIGTGQEFDGSDAGARPDEAVSWGKIRPGTKPVKIYTEVTVALPLIVAKAFVPYYLSHKSLYP